jgi:hypothetical protein
MKTPHSLLRAMVFFTGLVCTSMATATTGYFALGYGAKSMGLAGTPLLPQPTRPAWRW